MVRAVRGAAQLDENSRQAMEHWVPLLVSRLLAENKIEENDLVSIIFSQTGDLTAYNPASALRKNGFGSVPLFCTLEPEYPDSLSATVRVLITFNTGKSSTSVPVYLNGAESLRKDLFQNEK